MLHKNNKKPGEDKAPSREGLDKIWHSTKRSAKISMRIGKIAAAYSLEVSRKVTQQGIYQSINFAKKSLHVTKDALEGNIISCAKDHWKEMLLAAVISSAAYVGTDKALDTYDQWKDMSQRNTLKK